MRFNHPLFPNRGRKFFPCLGLSLLMIPIAVTVQMTQSVPASDFGKDTEAALHCLLSLLVVILISDFRGIRF